MSKIYLQIGLVLEGDLPTAEITKVCKEAQEMLGQTTDEDNHLSTTESILLVNMDTGMKLFEAGTLHKKKFVDGVYPKKVVNRSRNYKINRGETT